MKIVAPLIAVLLLVGCSKEKDVAYYKAHPSERGKRTADCETYHDDSQDCQNAREAQLEAYAVPETPEPAGGNKTDVAAVK